MIDSAGVLASLLAAAGFEDLLSVLIRVTLVAATGILLCSLVRKASAAKRHLIAMATLIALIAFPAAKVFLPAMDLPILPAAPTSSRTEATPTVSLADATNAIVPEARDGSAAERIGTFVRDVPGRELAGALILVYLAVYAALLLQILVSFLAAAATASRARRIDDAGLRRELRLACERLGVSRAVDLRESPGVTVPVVWGLFRPVLLLPVEARDWSREQLRVVFLHEVAHVARHDGVCLLLARIATAVFWFHPLVWQLARIARRECERCCDDLVLASGERATDYAAHLLAIVRSMSRPSRFPDVAPAMAQRSNLEGRLASILYSGQRRDPVSRSRLVVTIGFAALLLGAATAVHVVAAPESAGAGDLALGPALDGYRDSEDVATPNERVEKEPPIPIGDPSDPEGLASVGPRNALDATAESAQRTEVLEVSIAPVPVYVVAGRSSRSKRSALHESGIELMRAGQYAQAITAFEEEIRQSGSVTAMYNLACAYSLRGDKRRAFDTLEGAIENGFDNTGHMTEDEDLRLLQGDPHFYQLVRLARDLQLFGSGRYGGMDDEEDWRRELPRLERVTREHPDVGRAWANLGFARLQAGDPKGATAAYERALHLGYQKPRTFYNLACCASRSGSIDEAFGFLDRADKSGFEIGVYMGSDTDLNALRGDPRYKAMLDRWDEKMAKQHREKQRVEERQRTD